MLDLRVIRAQRIFSNGRHNAFTGIDALDGDPVVVFRTAEDHVSQDGTITVLGRDDETWTVRDQLASPVSAPDLRDPSLISFDDRLLLYTCASDTSTTPRTLTSLMATSTDGETFSDLGRVEGIPEGEWLWDIRKHGGTLYGTTREPALYRSETGTEWEKVVDFPDAGNETAIDFGVDGRLWALTRQVAGPCPVVYTAEPPYDAFESSEENGVGGKVVLKRLQGPFIKRFPGGLVIIGREYDLYGGAKHNATTKIWWRPDDREPTLIRALPSGGDTSYADWVDVAPGRALVTYYSGHADRMDLYHENDHLFEKKRAYAEQNSSPDIYLADIAYPTGQRPA